MWDWAIWGALIVAAAAVGAAVALLAVRGLRAWRDLKRTRRHVFRALDALLSRVEAVTENAAAAVDETSAILGPLARLRRSLARLAVLREAIDEARDTLGRFAAVMPRK